LLKFILRVSAKKLSPYISARWSEINYCDGGWRHFLQDAAAENVNVNVNMLFFYAGYNGTLTVSGNLCLNNKKAKISSRIVLSEKMT